MMKILMLGNSYTYFADMPQLLQGLIDANGADATVESVTAGGRRLMQNIDENDALHKVVADKCRETAYDVLILQEQSYTPAYCYRDFLQGAVGCVELVKPARTVFYATWGRKQGSDLLQEFGWTSEGMSAALAAAYDAAARKVGGTCAHVGKCFAALGASHPEIELYDPDLSHPSYTGSALAAIALYKKVFGTLPQQLGTLNLDSAVAAALLRTVDEII